MKNHIEASLKEAQKALDYLLNNRDTLSAIEKAAELIISTIESGGRVYSCGNGGSMSDAMHFAEELSGRYRDNRKALPGQAISDAGHLSCVSNDYGYEFVFSRYLEGHGKKGDCLVGISTSGTSKNVINAVEYSKSIGMNVVTLTGRDESKLGLLADVDVCTPAGSYADRVQELHIKVIHILIELIERHFFPENYK